MKTIIAILIALLSALSPYTLKAARVSEQTADGLTAVILSNGEKYRYYDTDTLSIGENVILVIDTQNTETPEDDIIVNVIY